MEEVLIPKPSGIFGVVECASKHIPCFYSDTSFKKHEQDRLNKQKRIEILSLRSTVTALKRSELQDRNDERHEFKKRTKKLAKLIEDRFDLFTRMESAAILIQKIWRGYVGRRSKDKEYIQIKASTVEAQKDYLGSQDFDLTFHAGLTPYLAGKLLTRNIKKWLFGRRIERIRQAYDYFIHEQMYISFELIRRVIYTFKSKQKVKWKLFKIYRATRIVEIKERLAVLSIKNVWVKLKLTYRLMKKRIRRFKRKVKQQQEADKAAEENGVEGESPDAPVEQVDDDQDSEEEQLRLKMEADRRRKIKMGKISYKIPKERKKSFLPYLTPKYIGSTDPDIIKILRGEPVPKYIPDEYDYMTKRLFDADGRPVFMNDIANHSYTDGRYEDFEGPPGYLKQTENSKMHRFDTVIKYKKNPVPEIKLIRKKEASTLMIDTKAYRYKKTEKYEVSLESKPAWVPSIRMKHRYTPSIDNISYARTSSRLSEPDKVLANRVSPISFRSTVLIKKKELPPEPEVPHVVHPASVSLPFERALPQYSSILQKYGKRPR